MTQTQHPPEAASPARPAGPPEQRTRSVGNRLVLPMAAAVVAFMVYQGPPYFSLDPSRSRIELHTSYHYWLIVGHVAFGTLALVTVVLQLWPWLRQRHPRVHRWSGRVYLLGALPAAAFALVMLPVTWPAGRSGVALSATLWTVAALVGWRRARQGRWSEHRRWMLYSFAVVWGLVIWGFAIGMSWFWFSPWQVDPDHVVEASRWVGWVVNLIAVQWWLNRTAGRPLELPATRRPRTA